MSVPLHAGTITDFLWGRLKDRDFSDFITGLEDDELLRREFEKEASFEALFYSLSWNIQTAPGLENETDWAALESPLSPTGNAHEADPLTAAEWNGMIKGAFDKAFPLTIYKKEPSRTIPFPKMFRYLAAACIIGAIAGIALVLQSHKTAGRPIATHAISTDTTGPKMPAAADKQTPVTSIEFDSIIIYSSRSLAGKSIATERCDGILKIGEKTAVLLDKSTSVAVTSQTDSAVIIDLASGGALFTVEKHRFHRFSVTTPAGDIAVTGTVFRLAIENDVTIVSVLEGSVRASRRHDTATVSIPAGTSARIRPDTIMVENNDIAATLLYRSNILRDFLRENGVWENGRFVRAGIGGKTDTVTGRSRDPEKNDSDDIRR